MTNDGGSISLAFHSGFFFLLSFPSVSFCLSTFLSLFILSVVEVFEGGSSCPPSHFCYLTLQLIGVLRVSVKMRDDMKEGWVVHG